MALLGQASGAFTESSSSLRILHVGIRNTVGVITDEAFEQTNPPIVTTQSVSDMVSTTIFGVLSGSVAFSRADIDENVIGGPAGSIVATILTDASATCRPLGVFINHAAGYGFENTPAAASNKCPYVSAQGTYANSLFETHGLGMDGAGTLGAAGAQIDYAAGHQLIASVNGYLTSADHAESQNDGYEVNAGGSANTVIGIVKMAPDNIQDELVYDQRI